MRQCSATLRNSVMGEAEAASVGLGRLAPTTTALFLCDLQEKFRPAVFKFDQIVHNTSKLGDNSTSIALHFIRCIDI